MTKNTWINFLSTKLIRQAQTKDGSKKFISVSVPFASSESGFATITVNACQVFPAKTRNGVTNDRFRNILLGKPDALRKVSVMTDKNSKTFETISITNADLANAFLKTREVYTSSKALSEAENDYVLPF